MIAKMMAARRRMWRARAGLRFAAGDAGLEREDDGGADDEEEVGEDEVGEGEAVPLGVVELGVGVGPVAGIVDEDHEGDGEAAKDVDGEDAGGCWAGRWGGLHVDPMIAYGGVDWEDLWVGLVGWRLTPR